jgi:acyl-coenzyme A thioesterase PaaI-like protein
MTGPVFISTGEDSFRATELARGPWDPNAQHGGAPAALLMRAFERLPAPDGLLITRVTYEFMRPVPLGELQIRAEVVRPGRRVQLLEASLHVPGGAEVARARALQVQPADPGATGDPDAPSFPGPGEGEPDVPRFLRGGDPFFGADAMDIRFVSGTFNTPGPATAWFRLKVPLLAGEDPSPLQRLAAAGDFGNGIAAALPWTDWVFINPDLTLYVERPPVGDWVGLDSRTRIAPGGPGVAESVLYDEQGRIGRAVQALLVARRPTSGGRP